MSKEPMVEIIARFDKKWSAELTSDEKVVELSKMCPPLIHLQSALAVRLGIDAAFATELYSAFKCAVIEDVAIGFARYLDGHYGFVVSNPDPYKMAIVIDCLEFTDQEALFIIAPINVGPKDGKKKVYTHILNLYWVKLNPSISDLENFCDFLTIFVKEVDAFDFSTKEVSVN